MMGVIGNFACMMNAMGRADPKNDYYEKCVAVSLHCWLSQFILTCVALLQIISGIVPLLTNISVLAAFPEKCATSGDQYSSMLGPGYICFLLSALLGNLPVAMIDIAMPAPPAFEHEAAMESESELSNSAVITKV
jgi:hypothetical protein